jgi:hypothetical protein
MSTTTRSTNLSNLSYTNVAGNGLACMQEVCMSVGSEALSIAKHSTYYAKELAKSTEGVRQTLRGTAAALRVLDTCKYIQAPQPFLKGLDSFNALGFATRLVYSIQDVTSGKLAEKIRDGKLLSVLSAAIDICFLCGKTLFTAEYLQGLKVIDYSGIVAKIGRMPCFGRLVLYPLMDYFFLTGCCLALIDTVQKIVRGQEKSVLYGSVDFLNTGIEGAITVFGLVGMSNPLVLASCTCIAASTAVILFFRNVEPPKF